MYANYDNELNSILKDSIRKLARDNHLLYDKPHGDSNGHFTSYYDSKNCEFTNSLSLFVQYLKSKFPEYESVITETSVQNPIGSRKIVKLIGTKKLLEAIFQYNQIVQQQFHVRLENYDKERQNVTPEISDFFKLTLERINSYYENNEKESYPMEKQRQIEECICNFFHTGKVHEQLSASKNLWDALKVDFRIESSTMNSDIEIEGSKVIR